MDYKLGLIVLPVVDVDAAKDFSSTGPASRPTTTPPPTSTTASSS